MHYKVKNLLIKTENAAKPSSQAAKAVLDWIGSRQRAKSALDFGCGKLRYSPTLAHQCEKLTLVDSTIQFDRTQRIDGKLTTVRDHVKSNFPNARLLLADAFEEDARKYDLAICANVLSAIPSARTRSKILRQISKKLTRGGVCLFVTQYTNSYFRTAASSPNAVPYLDGWILKTRRGNFYYGVLKKPKLERLLVDHGFVVMRSWINGQSVLIEATASVVRN